MQVFEFKYAPYGNEIETSRVLAHSMDEAERYLRILIENESRIRNLVILHSYPIATPTNFSVRGKDDAGRPISLNWKDKASGGGGVVLLWTDLPVQIKKKLQKAA